MTTTVNETTSKIEILIANELVAAFKDKRKDVSEPYLMSLIKASYHRKYGSSITTENVEDLQ